MLSSELLITFADTAQARRMLVYAPEVNVEAGLTGFVGWLRAEQLIEA